MSQKKPQTLDWNLCRTKTCYQQAALIMEGLTKIDFSAGEMQVVPVLAKHWQNVSDSRLVFKLKQGVTWSDGAPLEAKHFLFAWKNVLRKPKTPYAKLLFPIANAKAFSEGKVPFEKVGLRAPDPKTLLIRFEKPTPNFVLSVSHPATWPKREMPTVPTPLPTLGPFLTTSMVPSEKMTYVRNPHYHGSKTNLDVVEIDVVSNAIDRITLFLNGEIDIADNIGMTQAAKLVKHPALRKQDSLNLIALKLNTKVAPLNSRLVRQTLSRSVNREELSRLLGWPNTLASTMFDFFYTSKPSWALSFAPKAAKKKLSRRTKKKLRESYLRITNNRSKRDREIVENLRAQWSRHLNVHLTRAQSADELPPQLSLIELPFDPYTRYWGLHHKLEGSNQPKGRELRRKLLKSTTRKQWERQLEALDRWFTAQHVSLIPLFFHADYALVRPHLKSLLWHPTGRWELERVRIALH